MLRSTLGELQLHTSWQNVYRSVESIVLWGLARRNLDGIEALGGDEMQRQRGHKYLRPGYQIDEDYRRALWAGKDRMAKTLWRFFRMLGKERPARLGFVCSDMWKPYLKVIAKKAGQAAQLQAPGVAQRPRAISGITTNT